MASSSGTGAPEADRTLAITITSTVSLLQQFESALDPTSTTTAAPAQQQQDALCVLQASATLVRAHTTKLSLLVLNKPFTPPAIVRVLDDLSTTALPALLSAAAACTAQQWGTSFAAETRGRVRRLLGELQSLVHDIPRHGGSLPSSPPASRDSLAATGVVWAACDGLAALKTLGLGGVLAQRAQAQHDVLEDAMAELDGWAKEEPSPVSSPAASHPGEEDEGEEDEGEEDFAELFAASNRLPKDDEVLRPQLAATLKTLARLKMLYKAVIKRRLLTLPASPPEPTAETAADATPPPQHRVDRIMHSLETIPSETDDMANAFYELDGADATARLDRCSELARVAAEMALWDWEGREDAFSHWIRKWLEMLDEK